MAYRSVFIFDDASDWTSDWSCGNEAALAVLDLDFLPEFDVPYERQTPANRWNSVKNVLGDCS